MGVGILETRLDRVRKLLVRGASALGGAAIIYHEVVISDSAELPLIFLGMWLLGIPPALFLDGLRKVTSATTEAMDEVAAKVTGENGGRRRDDE